MPKLVTFGGRGLMRGIEFVEDRSIKQPFTAALRAENLISQAAMEHDLLCNGAGGTIDGVNGGHVLIALRLLSRSTRWMIWLIASEALWIKPYVR